MSPALPDLSTETALTAGTPPSPQACPPVSLSCDTGSFLAAGALLSALLVPARPAEHPAGLLPPRAALPVLMFEPQCSRVSSEGELLGVGVGAVSLG